MMDLDRFKTVNDTYGHAAGDRVLAGFARYITAHLRPYDKISRYGGEEFLLCLTDTDLETAQAIIDRLREELASLPFDGNGKGSFHVTASFGLVALDPDQPVERSIERSDQALYAAKANGRDRAVAWHAAISGQPDHAEQVG